MPVQEQQLPLENAWSLYLDDGNFKGITQEEEFFNKMTNIGSFDSIKTFWSYHHACMRTLSTTERTFNLRMFKHGIKPIWEDEANKTGGRWVIRCPSDLTDTLEVWMELAMGAVGSAWNPSKVCGCVLSCKAAKRRTGNKRANKIEVWVSAAPRVGSRKFREVKASLKALCRRDDVHLDYTPHDPESVASAPKPSKASTKTKVPPTKAQKKTTPKSTPKTPLGESTKSVNKMPMPALTLPPAAKSAASKMPSLSLGPSPSTSPTTKTVYAPWFRPIGVSDTSKDKDSTAAAKGKEDVAPAPGRVKRGYSAPLLDWGKIAQMNRVASSPNMAQSLKSMVATSNDRQTASAPASLHSGSAPPSEVNSASEASDSDTASISDETEAELEKEKVQERDNRPLLTSRGTLNITLLPTTYQKPKYTTRSLWSGYSSHNQQYGYQNTYDYDTQQYPTGTTPHALTALHDLICRTRQHAAAHC